MIQCITIILFLTIFCIMFNISSMAYKTIYNPVNLFNVVWLLFGSLAMMGLWGLRVPQITTVCIIITCVLSYNITCIIAETKNKYRVHKPFLLNYTSYTVNKKVLIVCNLLAQVYLIPFTIKSLTVIQSRGWTQLRYYILNNTFIFTKMQSIVCSLIIYPIFFATSVVCVATILSKRKFDVIILITIIDMAIHMITTGGRGLIFIFLLSLIITHLFNEDRKKYNMPFKYKCVIVIGVILLIYVTANRSVNAEVSILQNIFYYFIGPFAYFDTIICNPNEFSLFVQPTFGLATFGCIFSVFQLFLSKELNFNVEAIDNIISSFSGKYYAVSPYVRLNHVSTMLYPMMFDFGYLGIVLGPIIFALIISFVNTKARTDREQRMLWISIMIYLFYTIFASSYEYILLWGNTFFIILYIILFTLKIKVNQKSETIYFQNISERK